MPLLYRSLKNTCPEAVPGPYRQQLRDLFLANAARNVLLTNKLLEVLNLFKQDDIAALPFKGPVLAESVYGDLSLRQFVDLDVLVHKHDVLKARDLLVSNRYNPDVALNAKQATAYVRTENNLIFVRHDGKIIIELHWELSGNYAPCPLDLEMFEKRLETATLDGKNVLNLSPEDLLFYLCLHGCKDHWEALDHVCCVAELLKGHSDIDWERVAFLVERLRCDRMLFLGLFLAHDLLAAALPENVLAKIESDSKIRNVAVQVYQNLFDKKDKQSENGISSRFSFFHIAVRERLSEKLRYTLHLMFSPTAEDWRVFPLPAAFSFLHHLLRPGRLAVGVAMALLRKTGMVGS